MSTERFFILHITTSHRKSMNSQSVSTLHPRNKPMLTPNSLETKQKREVSFKKHPRPLDHEACLLNMLWYHNGMIPTARRVLVVKRFPVPPGLLFLCNTKSHVVQTNKLSCTVIIWAKARIHTGFHRFTESKLVRIFRMIQKPRKGGLRELKSKTFPGKHGPGPL